LQAIQHILLLRRKNPKFSRNRGRRRPRFRDGTEIFWDNVRFCGKFGFADTAPVASYDTPEGRMYNRRVDVIILDDGHL
jgi:hypothetical protein